MLPFVVFNDNCVVILLMQSHAGGPTGTPIPVDSPVDAPLDNSSLAFLLVYPHPQEHIRYSAILPAPLCTGV